MRTMNTLKQYGRPSILKNLGEYSNLYVKTDVLILADVMEHFRDVCMDTYNLDPAWYFSAPGLSWDAMLKTTKVRLELLDDYDMILMLEKAPEGRHLSVL
ncbi:uncharacterized protein TNCV_1078851 [Trichonephila clavipes]|nr:uncharacterized protein TNCV_1078851 [Trichonephila clavipes]